MGRLSAFSGTEAIVGWDQVDRELFKDRMRGTASILLRRATAILIAIFTVIVSASMPVSVDAVDDVEAAQRPPLSVPIFISSRDDLCYDNGQVAAIRRLAVQEQRRINRNGGVAGRRLQLTFLDDQRDEKKAAANMGLALSDPQTLAMIGMSNSTRAKAAFDASGKDIKKTGIPFVSDISVAALIADYPNVFTTRPSEDEERMPVIAEFVKQMKIVRPAFVGLDGQLASSNFGDALTKLFGTGVMAADHRLHMVGDDLLDPGELASTIADLKSKNIDMVFLSVGGSRTADVLKKFKAEGLTPPAFVTGRLTSLGLEGDAAYPNDIFQLAWDGFPDVYNDRLR